MTSSLTFAPSTTVTSALVIPGDCDLAAVIETTLNATAISYTRARTMMQAAKMLHSGLRPGMILIDLSTEQALKFVKEAKKIPALAKVQCWQ